MDEDDFDHDLDVRWAPAQALVGKPPGQSDWEYVLLFECPYCLFLHPVAELSEVE